MGVIVQVNSVTKKYRNGRGIEAINLALEPGEIHVLLGANGAGKSTLMRVMAGLAIPDAGEVHFYDKFGSSSVLRKRLEAGGFLIEQPEPFGYLSAFENVMQKGRYYPAGRASATDALIKVGLEKHGHEKARNFSTGMKQRLGLATALTGNPCYLVLDEPTNGMDIEGRADLHELLLGLKQNGLSIFLSTHLVHEAEAMADRISVIHEGRLLESGLKKELLKPGKSLEQWYLTRVREASGKWEAVV